MKFCKKTLSFILAFMLMFSTFNPLSAMSDRGLQKTTIKGQELVIGDKVYYIFSTDKNAKSDLIKAQEKGEVQLEELQAPDGLEISGGLHQASVGAGETKSYTIHIKGTNFKGVGGKTFDWDTLQDGLEIQLVYIDNDGKDITIGDPIVINKSNYKEDITRTHEISGEFLAFAMKTNVDTETYLTDVYQTNVNSPSPWDEELNMTFDLVQVPSTNLSVKWVDVNKQELGSKDRPSKILKNVLTFNFIGNKKFDLPNYDKEEPYFRLVNKLERKDINDMEGATALVDGKKNGEEVTLDGKIYKLITSYNPAFNEGSKIQLMYMPDVIDRTNNPDAETPENYVRVTIDAGEGTKLAQGEKKKVYDVRKGKVLKAEHYPKLELLAGHKDPITWTIAPETAITKAEDILGKADKTAAEKITAENLKAVDTTALQGQDLDEKFWHKGVVLADTTPEDKKEAFAALLKDATVTDKSSRTTAKDGTFEGTLLVTFKDGSTLEVPNQKLIVKPNTVKVELDKDAQGSEKPLRDGDTTVKGKISASSNEEGEKGFKVSLDGAVVTIKKGDTVLSRTLAKADGSFVAGVKDPLIAGEDISVVVTLPESKTESAPVTEKVQLNPDKLNEIIPTGQAVVKNLKGKKGVDQAKVTKLEEEITKAFTLVDKAGENQKQKDQKVKSTVTVNEEGQKSLDDQYEAIKKAIEALTGNSAPEVKGTTSHKEIFKGDALNLEEGITVTDKDGDNDIVKDGEKAFTYTVEKVDAKGNKTKVEDTTTIKDTAGTYEVTYTAKDKSGAEGKFIMTLVVKEPVVEIKEHFPEVIPEGYVKVEFKEGKHGKLEGTTKFLVKDGSAKTILNAPGVTANKNWKVNAEKPWDPAIPETFTGTEENKKSFVFTAQYTYTGPDVVEEEPGKGKPDVPDNFVKVEFKKGEHGVISSEEKFAFWVNPEKEVTLTAPTVTPSHGYKHTGWKPEVKAKTKYTEAKEFVAQYKATVVTEDPNDKEHYAKVDFAAGDQGKFEQVDGKDQVTTFWVWKGEKVSFNAPKVTANENYKFKEWDKPIQETYDADTTHTATYESTLNISDTEVKGYQEVKFVAGNDGNFGKDNEQKLIKEKSVWVKPDTLVDLTDKAPKVTVTTTGKSHIGWDKDLVQTFTKADQATVINAKYGDTVTTKEPKQEDKEKYAKVDFVAGNLGTIAEGTTKTYWVVKGEQVTATFKAPTVTAKDGWKVKEGKDAWSPQVATKYAKDTIHLAQYDYVGASVVPQKPGDEKPNVPENFVKVEFKKGEHGVISSEETFIYWVDPTKPVTAEFKAPKVIADTNYKHIGWNPALTANQTFAEATDIVAQYKSTVLTEDPNDENYVTVEFKAGEHGTLTGDAKFWVYKNEKVSITAPTVTAKTGYTFNKWDPEVKETYAEPTVHNATYTTNNNVSDTEVEGYNKVTFKAGAHGTLTEKSVWVKPDTLVDLNDKAPKVTPEKGYSHIGWKPGLVGKFENNTDIVAQYSNNISDTPVEGWTELTFDQGDHGKFAKGAKNVKWVNPKADLKLSEIAPAIVADTNYSHDGWKDGETKVDLETAQKFETAKTFTATYKSNVLEKDEHDKLPEDEKKNFVQITFDKGANGKFPKEAVTEVYVKKDVAVDLTEKAPTVIPNQGYGHSGWEPALKGTFSTATTIKAQYKEGTFDENAIKEIIVLGPTKMGYGVGDNLDLTGLKVIAKDDAGLQKTYEGLDAIKAAGFNIEPADKKELKMADNGKHIVVTKGEGQEKVTGQTETTLTIHENKSAKAEDVKALNQNKVVEGKVTNEPKDTTTVTGKVKKDATVKILDENGKDITPQDITVDENGNFTAEVEKQNEGKKVQVIATEEGKQPSDPADAIVARDADNNKIADKDEQTERPAAIASNKGKKPAFTIIEGKTEKGAVITVTVKVNGEEKPVTVENFVNNDGEYTLEAKYNGKPLENGAEILVYAQNTPKKISEPQTTTVFNDFNNDGKPDGGKVDLEDVKDIQVIAPNKMSYTQGDKLVGTGLKAIVRDNKGGIEIFDYDNTNGVFKNSDNEEVKGITAKVADKTIKDLALTEKDHNGKAIDVTIAKGIAGKDEAKGSTNQTLEVKQLQTPTPTIEFAANQNTVGSTGQATQTAKQKTTVKFTVKNKPTTVYVKYTVNGKAEEETFEIGANDEATKTVDLQVKLPVGADVEVKAKDADKTLSEAATAKVVRDANNDGTADDKTAVGEAVIDDIKAGSKEIKVKPADNATELVIKETDKDGKTPEGSTTITVKKDENGNWKIGDDIINPDKDGKLTIPTEGKLKLDEYNVVEVESKGDPDTTTPSNARKTVGKAKDTEAPAKPKVDQPVDGDENIKVKTPTEPDAKTITVEVTRPAKPAGPGEEPGKPTVETIVVTKGEDGNWKTPNGEKVPEVNGKLEIPVETNKPLKTGDDVKVTTTDNDDNNSVPYTEKVVAKIKMDKPEINPIKTGDRTVEGTALTNKGKPDKFAASTVDIYKYQPPTEEGKEGTWTRIAKDVAVDQDTGAYKYNHDQGFKDGDKIRVVAKKPGAEDSFNEITAGVDTTALDKAIQDGKDALDKDKGGKNNGTPEDKALEDAIKKGEDLKKQDPAPTQEEVNKAQKDIEKAIKDKKDADEARDKLQEKINEANDKKNDPEYPTKPKDVKDNLDKAAKNGQTTHNDNNKSKEDIDNAIKEIQDKIDEYNKQQLAVSITPPVAGTLKMELITIPGNSKFKVYRGIVSDKNLIGQGTTNSGGIGTITFDENTVKLKRGMTLRVVVEHDGYLSRTEIVRVI
ncbi:Ig-like domain-containing protein [Peptoniphilus sp.]|uniref:Ig-like domain-containing protein n=1 Tax=Peptoniphilus sp. TaxID=1971214 RepID=UPI0039946AC0